MIRLSGRLFLIAASLILLLPFHYLWKLARRRSPWPRRFLFWVGYASGMRVRVVGRPLPSKVLFVANHVSWLDIMVLAGATGTAFVSKDDVARWPVMGWLAGLNNTIYVARSDRREVRGQADSVRNALATGQPVALFPEGTTEGGVEVLPFRASLFASLFPPVPNLRVQPVAIDYGADAAEIAWIGEEAAGANAKRVLSRRGTTQVTLTFAAPLNPGDFPDRKALAARCRADVLAAFEGGADRL
jgi:1-acyl-sn-glycerol-3-phosphate acyltransferase